MMGLIKYQLFGHFKFKINLFCLIVFFVTHNYAQPQKDLDSLINLLEINTKRDSARVKSLIVLSKKITHKNLNKAHDFVDEAFEISSELNWTKGKVIALRQAGAVYYREGNSLKAVEAWYEALSKVKNIKKPSEIEITLYGNLANVYADSGEFEKAMVNYHKFLNLSNALNIKKYQIQALTNIGILLTEKETRIDEGIESLEKALKIVEEDASNQQYVVSILSNIGLGYKRKKDYEKAKEYYLKANTLSKKTANKYVEMLSLNNLCGLSVLQFNYQEGEVYAKKALALAEELGTIEWQSSAWGALSVIYENKNDAKKALAAYKNYMKLNDSLLLIQNKEKINELEKKYEYNQEKNLLKAEHEKKQLLAQEEIEKQKLKTNASIYGGGGMVLASIIGFILYRRKQEAIAKSKEAEFKTKVADTELKVLRAQMNPHFIFNALNSIGNYILNNDTDAANSYLTKFSKLMRQTLESSEKETISLSQDIELLKTYLDIEKKRLVKGFDYEIKTDAAIDLENILIPPMILQPFVENSIWHGISKLNETGFILIAIKKEGNMIIYSVDDNGIGRHKSKASHALKKASLGIKITKNRIDIINKRKNTNASLNIIDKKNGTRVEVKLPIEIAFQ